MAKTLEERIAMLPAWAQDHIKRLELRSEPAIEDAARARKALGEAQQAARRLGDANSALMELLSCAGRAGIDWAAKVVEVLEGYEVFRLTEGTTDKQD